ncbi:MAG: hypothetical protein JNL40_02295 [Cyclobacteriaceae bacterium]|nr:hypothetical protein [Cyclobacteriaceae bacterium]
MDTNTVLFLRNFFLRSFLVGIIIAIGLFVATFALQSIWMPLLTRGFNLEESEVSEVVLASLLNIRIVLLFLLLAPGLALHWMAQGKK